MCSAILLWITKKLFLNLSHIFDRLFTLKEEYSFLIQILVLSGKSYFIDYLVDIHNIAMVFKVHNAYFGTVWS